MILLIHGEETFLSLRKISQIKDKFLKENTEMGVITRYTENDFNLEDFTKKVLAIAFFEEKKLFILENILSSLNETKSDRKDKQKSSISVEKIIEVLNTMPESSLIVFLEKDKLPKNLLTKNIEKMATKIWEFEKIQTYKLSAWTKNEITKKGASINKEALEKLIAYSNNDIWQLSQEIEKLTLYKHNKEIGISDIEKLVPFTLQTNIFTFIDNIGKKNKKAALYELKNILDKGEEPVYILRMIIYQIKNMLIVKDLSEQGINKSEIAKKTKKHPFVVEKTLSQVNNFSLEELLSIYDRIFDLELTIKRGGQKSDNALLFFAESLC